jgi:SAM-dependent methyltransferase
MTEPTSAFDGLASEYDATFTHSVIGTILRQAVWRRADACFGSGDHVLELNCGTGEDALHLARRGVQVLATDVSSRMLDVGREKIAAAGVGERVTFRRMAIEEFTVDEAEGFLRDIDVPSGFDGALSNFGGLNCVADLTAFATGLSQYVRPGGVALCCVMGPVVPWEWAWFLARGRPTKAWRRLRRRGAVWRGVHVHYPTIRAVRRAFSPAFRAVRVSALGALVPPPYTERAVGRFPRLLRFAAWCERRLATIPPLPWLADHYLVEFRRM